MSDRVKQVEQLLVASGVLEKLVLEEIAEARGKGQKLRADNASLLLTHLKHRRRGWQDELVTCVEDGGSASAQAQTVTGEGKPRTH